MTAAFIKNEAFTSRNEMVRSFIGDDSFPFKGHDKGLSGSRVFRKARPFTKANESQLHMGRRNNVTNVNLSRFCRDKVLVFK